MKMALSLAASLLHPALLGPALLGSALLGPACPAVAKPLAPTGHVDARRLADLASFVDGVVAQQIATREVAGAVVTVVANGHVLFTRGYGYADLDARKPVVPDTLFHPGSVSKLFTWIALMQQVEQGRVSLDADVNRYIDFAIPPYQGQPIRVRDLLSHSAGLSDVSGVITYDAAKVVPYAVWLKTKMPRRLWAPGTEIAYSNWGAALAGYIVERVSGEPFADYAERHLFAPLRMTSTSFREPLPPALAARLARGYKMDGGRLVATGPEYLGSVMPAGSSSSTGPDMARFLLAVLNGGSLDGARILKAETLRSMESDLLTNTPGMPGMAHGWLVEREAGPRLIGHAGNTVDFHSDLVIAPQLGVGFFVSFTGGEGSSAARTELRDALIGRLFPAAPSPRWTGSDATPVAGSYRDNRRDYAEAAKPEHDVKVSVPAPHRVVLTMEGRETAWEEVGPGEYEQVTGARDGGPYDRIRFYGPPRDRRLSFASHPYEAFHLVP